MSNHLTPQLREISNFILRADTFDNKVPVGHVGISIDLSTFGPFRNGGLR